MNNPFAVARKYLPSDSERAAVAVSEEVPLDDPMLSSEQWFPSFRDFHHLVVRESNFDYQWLKENRLELFRKIRAKEAQIDALGEARLSEVMEIMREWRELILQAEFEQRTEERNG